MNIHISDNWQWFIQEEVKSERYASADQVLDEALRLLKARDQAPSESLERDSGETALSHKPIWEVFEEISGSIPGEEWAKLPADGSEQLDHYIYGTPKRPTTRGVSLPMPSTGSPWPMARTNGMPAPWR